MVWGVAPQRILKYLASRKGSFCSGIVIQFPFRFHASTHHCRYYCLFLAVNYRNIPRSPFSFFALRPRPSSSSNVLRSPTAIISIFCSYDQNSFFLFFHLFSGKFQSMVIRRIRAKASAKATSNTTDNTSAIFRRAQPRAVAVTARKPYLKHTQRNVQDIDVHICISTHACAQRSTTIFMTSMHRSLHCNLLPYFSYKVISTFVKLSQSIYTFVTEINS